MIQGFEILMFQAKPRFYRIINTVSSTSNSSLIEATSNGSYDFRTKDSPVTQEIPRGVGALCQELGSNTKC